MLLKMPLVQWVGIIQTYTQGERLLLHVENLAAPQVLFGVDGWSNYIIPLVLLVLKIQSVSLSQGHLW
jgi:hypothetical protein